MRFNLNVMTDRIKELKKKKNITNAQLSEKSGVPYGTINKILAGETSEPSVNAIAKIAAAMNVSVDYIVNGKVDSSAELNLTGAEKLYIKKYKKIDERGKEIIRCIIDEEYKQTMKSPVPVVEKSDIIPIKLIQQIDIEHYNSKFQNINIKVSELAEQADFAVKVSGNSMEPTFTHGDILLVESTPFISNGDIGVFLVNGEGMVKEFSGDRLISHDVHPDIKLRSHDVVICFGKVIGVLEDEDFVD